MSEIDDFVRHHPHGGDMKPPDFPKRQMHSYIPTYHAQAVLIEAILAMAKAEGCTPREIEKLRTAFYASREPELVSLDDIYGKEE